MHAFKQLTKSVIAYFLYYSGIIAILCKKNLKNRLVVLMYHRVLNNQERSESFSNPGIIVSKNTFKTHIEHLAKHFNPLSIDQVIAKIDQKSPFQCGECLITFDDGWYDNYQNALKILESQNVPSLIFLPVDYIGTGKLFWQEQLARFIFYLAHELNEVSPVLKKHGLASLHGEHPDKLRGLIFQYLNTLKQQSNKEIDSVVDEFREYFKTTNLPLPDNTIDKYINWEQVQEMSKKNVSFGSHATSHRLLTKLTNDDLNNELMESREHIESKLQKPILSIAYPNGNYDDTVLKSASDAGYKAAFTTESGYFSTNDNPHKIKRINIHQSATQNIPLFLCRILGIF